MEPITSRKNPTIRALRGLGADRAEREEKKLFLCAGDKLLTEALAAGAEIPTLLCTEGMSLPPLPGTEVYVAERELLSYVSPLENNPGPVFTVSMRPAKESVPKRVLILENVQDPGNVGTVLRTAAAFRSELVIFCGDCADPYNPKAVRASMGAIFRQDFERMRPERLFEKLKEWSLPLYGAALHAKARDIRELSLERCAVAVGNEGKGLSGELLAHCEEKLIIPMEPASESLNAAVAASLILWEMYRR